ncbi:MAG TPA: hypothetical protein DCW60_00435 [Sutterella sp.]|nr:hypothetical protein [Sutterella sp.]
MPAKKKSEKVATEAKEKLRTKPATSAEKSVTSAKKATAPKRKPAPSKAKAATAKKVEADRKVVKEAKVLDRYAEKVKKVEDDHKEPLPLDENGDEQINFTDVTMKRKAEMPDFLHPLLEKTKFYMHRRVPVLIGAAIAIVIVIFIVAFASVNHEYDGVRINDVFVQNEVIDAYFKDAVKEGYPNTPEAREKIRTLVLEEAFLASEASKLSITNKPDVQRRIDSARARVLIAAMVEDYAAKHPATDEELRKAYEANKALYGTQEYKIRHIAVDSEADAKAVIDRLNRKESFAKLVAELSIDRDRAVGGVQVVRPGMGEEAFVKAVTALKVGEYTKVPVKSSKAWQIVLLESVNAVPAYPSFESQKEALAKYIALQKARAYFHNLADNAKIEEVR